jgi:hypothetical protein
MYGWFCHLSYCLSCADCDEDSLNGNWIEIETVVDVDDCDLTCPCLLDDATTSLSSFVHLSFHFDLVCRHRIDHDHDSDSDFYCCDENFDLNLTCSPSSTVNMSKFGGKSEISVDNA